MINNKAKVDLSIIIVTYNNEVTIKGCLDSLRACDRNTKLIVFDNNSTDRTVATVKKYRDVILIESEINLGFGKASNRAAKKATGDYLLFLNPDTKIIDKLTLVKLIDSLSANPEYGLIGPKVIFADGKLQKTVRNNPTVMNAVKEYIFKIRGSFDFYEPKCQSLCEVESIKGAAMVVKRKLFEEIGGFNEKYFIYFEDLDLCRSIRERGLKVGYLPSVTICHIEGVSGKGQDTIRYSQSSAKLYHGVLANFLINWIGRIGNKL